MDEQKYIAVKGNYIVVNGNNYDLSNSRNITVNISDGKVSSEEWNRMDTTDIEADPFENDTLTPTAMNYPPDEVCLRAFKQMMVYFSVGSQWAAIYRVMSECYGKSENIAEFCRWVNDILGDEKMDYPCSYDTIRKILSSNNLLSEPYRRWFKHNDALNEKSFLRQRMIAQNLVNFLTEAGFPPQK